MLFLGSWGSQTVPEGLGSGKAREMLKDRQNIPLILNALRSLGSEKGLPNEERLSLMNALTGKDKSEYLEGLRLLEVLCHVGCFSQGLPVGFIVNGKITLETLRKQFEEYTSKIFGIGITYAEYEKQFNTRIPHALATYASRINNVPEAKDALQNCLKWIKEGRFEKQRYSPDNSAHLKKLSELHPDVLAKWQIESKPVPVVVTGGDKSKFSFTDFLHQKLITDKHWPGFEKECPALSQWLLNREFQIPEDLKPIEEMLLELCKDESGQVEKLQGIERALPPNIEFANDIKACLQLLVKIKNTESMEVVNVGDYKNMLLSGTEVLGSCQRVDGDPGFNKCLLAYIMDGKNRMLAVRCAKTGKIEARCIFRLLFDKDGKPALFIDRIYPTNTVFVEALYGLAKTEAARMGLPLYKLVRGQSDTPLFSLGSVAPFEYEDAAEGVMRNGVFTIQGAVKVDL